MANWVVKSGDTLWGIATKLSEQNGKSVTANLNEIRRLNPALASSNLIRGGQSLVMPASYSASNPTTDSVADTDTDIPSLDDVDDADLQEMGAVPALLSDPQYRAFMATFGMTESQAESQLTASTDRLMQNALRTFGEYGGEVDEEGTPLDIESALMSGNREGGLYDIAYDKAVDRDMQTRSGRGMAFGGGRQKAMAEFGEQRDIQELTAQQEIMDAYSKALQAEKKAKEDNRARKLLEEAAATERLSNASAGI